MTNRKELTFVTFVTSLGGILEMYDFVIYAMLANILSQLFFPTSDHYIALLQVFGIFAVGYLSRPLGGILFGHIGDRYGRQKGLILSMLIMGIPIFLLGCLPTYASIGKLAPFLLLILRFLTGISVGGEFPSGTAYLAEHAPAKHRGLIASFIFFGINLGIVLASLVGTILTNVASQHFLMSWGWRIPFLFGGVLAAIGYLIRKKMIESPVFIKFKQQKNLRKSPVVALLHEESRQVSRSFSIVCLMAACISLVFLFMPTYLHNYLHISLEKAFTYNTINLVVFTILIPCFAWLSDLSSRNFILSASGFLFLFLSVPIYYGLNSGSHSIVILCLLSLGIMSAMVVGPMAATLAERFRTSQRTSGIALSYNFSFGLVGGLAPLAVTFLLHITNTTLAPAFYLMLTAVLTLMAVINHHDFARCSIDKLDARLQKLSNHS